MTRKEALKILKECCDKGFNRTTYTYDEYVTARDMAINALEQEPLPSTQPEPLVKESHTLVKDLVEDAISRQAVLELAKKGVLISNGNYKSVCKAINGIPSVTTQPKTECSCEQIKWERDTAIAQLKELGYGLGEKPKTGHWILKRTFPTKLYDEHLNEYKCSECYRGIRCTESQLVNYPYCHCGAKMESEGK